MRIPKTIYIIGAGGVTSYLLPLLVKTLAFAVKSHPEIIVQDGDKLEPRNLERQLFRAEDAENEVNKAEALVSQYEDEYPGPMTAIPEYFGDGSEVKEGSLLFICVDNHAARKSALGACDRNFCNAIIAANEYIDSQAMWYDCLSKDTKLDPRVIYPEILTDEGDDPIRPIGCDTREALTVAPQLAISNFHAADSALQLFWFYHAIAPDMEPESRIHWPIEYRSNINKRITKTEKDYA